MRYPKELSLRSLIGFLFIVIGILVIVFVPRINGGSGERLFYISGYGEVLGELPKEEDTLIYSITIENPGNKNYTIKSIEPIITDEIRVLLLDNKPRVIKETRKLRSNKEIEFKGQLKISTIKLSEEAVKKLLPAIKEYKITYDDGEIIYLRSGI